MTLVEAFEVREVVQRVEEVEQEYMVSWKRRMMGLRRYSSVLRSAVVAVSV